MPGLQEAAAKSFDKLLETGNAQADGSGDVSKMLAKRSGVESEPWGSRTPDALIKRYKPLVPPGDF